MSINFRHYFFLIILSALLWQCNNNRTDSNRIENTQNVDIGIDTLKTLSSFTRIADNLYEISFYGDYTKKMEEVNQEFLSILKSYRFNCSLFSILGDSSQYFLGRSFDNGSTPDLKHYTLACKCYPSDGYKSISFVRMDDIGFIRDTAREGMMEYEKITNFLSSKKTDLTYLSHDKKLALFCAPYFPPDGINEKGLSVALANYYPACKYNIDSLKDTISYTYLVRQILDNCKDVEEAVDLIKSHNVVFFAESNEHFATSEVHLMLSDAKGNSLIAEVYDGEFRFIEATQPWQIATNSRTYNLTEEYKKEECFRYDTLYTNLSKQQGVLDKDAALNLLHKVGFPFTQWSALYDISNKKVTLALEHNFDIIYEYSFEE